MRKNEKHIDLRPLKEFVSIELPSSSELRAIVLQEKDTISAKSYPVKAVIWRKLMREETMKK